MEDVASDAASVGGRRPTNRMRDTFIKKSAEKMPSKFVRMTNTECRESRHGRAGSKNRLGASYSK